jgi:hypothetical protein
LFSWDRCPGRPVPDRPHWSLYLFSVANASAAHQNDEVLLLIHSPLLAHHFEAEMDRLWRGAELGVTDRLQRKLDRQRRSCGSGTASTVQ